MLREHRNMINPGCGTEMDLHGVEKSGHLSEHVS